MKKHLFALVVATLLLSGCNSQTSSLPYCATSANDPVVDYYACKIDIRDFKYSPDYAFIKTGTTVTWFNYDEAQHSVYASGGGGLESGPFDKGASWSHVFNASEEIIYGSRHPASLQAGTMRGRLKAVERK